MKSEIGSSLWNLSLKLEFWINSWGYFSKSELEISISYSHLHLHLHTFTASAFDTGFRCFVDIWIWLYWLLCTLPVAHAAAYMCWGKRRLHGIDCSYCCNRSHLFNVSFYKTFSKQQHNLHLIYTLQRISPIKFAQYK